MLKDAALLTLELMEQAPRRGPDPQGRHPLQRPVARRRPGVHRRRLVRAPARGRAVVRLPPVLHAVPLSADAAELSRGPLPARCFAGSSTGSRPSRCATCSRCAIASAAACSPTSSCTPGSSAATRSAARPTAREELKRAGLQARADQGQRRPPGAAGAQARLEARADRNGRSTARSPPTTRRSSRDKEALRRVGGRRRPHRSWSGTSAATTGASAGSPPADGAYVVAIDGDEVAVDRLYRELRSEGSERILPLALDLVDASPGLGWRGSERQRLEQRRRPDLVLALALVHHLAIGANVPLAGVVDWLADLGAALVIEFPTREDPMVARLLSRKREDAHPDYGLETFEAPARTSLHRRPPRAARQPRALRGPPAVNATWWRPVLTVALFSVLPFAVFRQRQPRRPRPRARSSASTRSSCSSPGSRSLVRRRPPRRPGRPRACRGRLRRGARSSSFSSSSRARWPSSLGLDADLVAVAIWLALFAAAVVLAIRLSRHTLSLELRRGRRGPAAGAAGRPVRVPSG